MRLWRRKQMGKKKPALPMIRRAVWLCVDGEAPELRYIPDEDIQYLVDEARMRADGKPWAVRIPAEEANQ